MTFDVTPTDPGPLALRVVVEAAGHVWRMTSPTRSRSSGRTEDARPVRERGRGHAGRAGALETWRASGRHVGAEALPTDFESADRVQPASSSVGIHGGVSMPTPTSRSASDLARTKVMIGS